MATFAPGTSRRTRGARRSRRWSHAGGTPSPVPLAELQEVLVEAIEDSQLVDAFVVQPGEEEPQDAIASGKTSEGTSSEGKGVAHGGSGRGSQPNAGLGGSGGKAVGAAERPSLLGMGSAAAAIRQVPILKRGYLLRKSEHSVWGRRYFLLQANGVLRWFERREQVDSAVIGAADAETEASVGQLTLRFFGVVRCTDEAFAAALGRDDDASESDGVCASRCEDPELQRILPSCTAFELRSGKHVLQLAAQSVETDEWLHTLRVQCLLNYPKSPIFSDKEVSVCWMDGRQYTCAVGENTTAQDIVKRLCRSRTVKEGRTASRPLVHDASEWALFEVQHHTAAAAAAAEDHRAPPAGGPPSAPPSASNALGAMPLLHQLAKDEPILDQLLLRWEEAARLLYGAESHVPPGAFELRLRKVRSSVAPSVRPPFIVPEEQELEVCQARADFLEGRLTNLSTAETYELASVLALREMHVRAPREQGGATAAEKLRQALQVKQGNPTLDLDLSVDELRMVLPASARSEGDVEAHRRLKETYKALLKQPLDSWGASPRSQTVRLVQDVRREALGVSFDSKGQVVVDRRAADLILRKRLALEPSSFGSAFCVCVWTGEAGQPPRQLLLLLNHSGLHLHSYEPQPRWLKSFDFGWPSGDGGGGGGGGGGGSRGREVSTIIGWQTVAHQLDDSVEERELAAELGYGTTSLVIHLLVPCAAPSYAATPAHNGAARGLGGREQVGFLAGARSSARTSARTSARASARLSSKQAGLQRRRAKLVLLTREGEDIQAQLQALAQEHQKWVSQMAQVSSKPRISRISQWSSKGLLPPPSQNGLTTSALRPTPRLNTRKVDHIEGSQTSFLTDRAGLGSKLGVFTSR